LRDFKEPYYEGKECKCCKNELKQELAFAVGWDEGEKHERERLLKLLIDADTRFLSDEAMAGWYFAVKLIKGENE
jgi:hypothetical protein